MIRVLVVDDHPVVRHGLLAMLRYAPDLEVVGEAAVAAQAGSPTDPAATTAPEVGSNETAASTAPTAILLSERAAGVTAEGEIVPAQDASLLFNTTGTVAQVLVKEGDAVAAGQTLAALDTKALDLRVAQAEAALASAQAQLAGLSEGPRAASLAAAKAQVQSAEAALAQLNAGPKAEDVTSARAALQRGPDQPPVAARQPLGRQDPRRVDAVAGRQHAAQRPG